MIEKYHSFEEGLAIRMMDIDSAKKMKANILTPPEAKNWLWIGAILALMLAYIVYDNSHHMMYSYICLVLGITLTLKYVLDYKSYHRTLTPKDHEAIKIIDDRLWELEQKAKGNPSYE